MVDISNTITAAIAMIVIAIALLATLPIIIEQVYIATMNATTEWNFTGAEGAESLLGLIPFAWIAGIVVFMIAGAFMLAKGLGGGRGTA